MKQIRYLAASVVVLWTVASVSAATDIRQLVAKYFDALNRYEVDRSLAFYAPNAVVIQQQKREPLDRDANRGFREFEAAIHSRFAYRIHKIDGDTADVTLAESNDFYKALGSTTHKSRWLYRFHENQIYEIVQVGSSNNEYAQKYLACRAWIVRARPEQAKLVTTAEGNTIFNGRMAGTIMSLAREWESAQKNGSKDN